MGLSQAVTTNSDVAVNDTVDPGDGFASIKLTPPLVLTISLMFIIASDGHVDDAESSQIQSVIGQNEELVRFASTYVRAVSLKEFLLRAPHGLSLRDKFCVLSNVCDAMFADGMVHEIEQKTLHLLQAAFGISPRDFSRHLDTLKLKNDRTVLGDFRLSASHTSMTPHLALAASVLYMMSADGSIDKHEIGRLETLVAEYEGLQKLAVAYVRKTKRERFIQEAAYALTEEQKAFILLNVYDTMTSDGVIAVVEDKIFSALQKAFGVNEREFTEHVQVLEDKNFKPFDLRKVNVDHLFEMVEREQMMLHAKDSDSAHASLGEMVSRTIQDNVSNVKQDLGASANVIQIQTNAIDELKLQKIDAANDAIHRERLADEQMDANRQKLDDSNREQHREQLPQDVMDAARVRLPEDNQGANHQKLAQSDGEANQQTLPVELRIDHLHEDIEELHGQLTEFESKNRSWLNMGKIFQQEEERNRQKLAQEFEIENFQKIQNHSTQINRQKIGSDSALKEMPWPVGFDPADAPSHDQDHVSSGLLSNAEVIDTLHGVNSDAGHGHVTSQPLRGNGFVYEGRVLDFPQSRYRVSLKECLLAVALTVCVSNLGAMKQDSRRVNAGVLQKLESTTTVHEAGAVLSVGP